MSFTSHYISSPVVNVDVQANAKVIFLPVVSTVPGQAFLIRDGTGYCSPANPITISTQAFDKIDITSNRITLNSAFASVGFTTFGVSNWSIVSNYPTSYVVPPPPGWQAIFNGDGAVTINSNVTVTLSTITPNNGVGAGWSFAYLFTTVVSGSITYNYSWKTNDGLLFDWPFENVSPNTPPVPPTADFVSTKIATADIESGTRTLSWSNQLGGVFISLGVYSVDSLFGPGYCGFTNLPLTGNSV